MPATDCLPRATLKRYLVGGTDEQLSGVIEEHLSECESCEQTIVELETEPDTLCEAVRQPTSHSNSSAPQLGPTIADAIAAAQEIMSTSEPVAAPPNLMKRIGSYELLKTLGRGGMGTVMLARHTSLGKQVAVKLLPTFAGDRADLAARFQREVRAAGRLNHPAIVSATDAGYESGMHFLVMEYVTGLDLSRIARLTGPLKIADACEAIRQAALGLAYAHSEGIVHRDIKPSNLMLDASGQIKILDFGLVQLSSWDEAACELTTIGQLMGTLDYMAPEQAERAGSVDHRADIYALGATLFRLLAGRPPLAATPNLSLLEKIKLLAAERPPLVSTLRPDCPDGLVQVIASLLQHDPTDRPSSAAHVAEALLPFCEGHDLPKLQAAASSAASVVVESSFRLPSHPAEEAASPDPALQTTTANSDSAPPTSRFRSWLAAAAALPLLIAGIFITLEMKKGQLVIQSQVDNVQVRIAQDGKIVDQWTVHPGAQSTRLRADKYEILIEGASDSIAVDNQSVVVRSGETVVATITEKTQATQGSLPPTPQPTTEPPRDPNELVYQDKTLTQWLAKLKVERDRELQGAALKAIETLTTPSSRDMVDSSLTELIAQTRNKDAINACIQSLTDETKWTDVRTGSHQFQLDILQPILRHSTPQQISELFKSIADGKDRELTDHWVGLLVHFNSTPESMKEWAATQIRSDQFAELAKDSAAMVTIAAYAISSRDAEWRTQNLDQLFQAMSRHPDFGTLWVLESSPLALSSKIVPGELQPDQVAREEAVGRFALNVIRNPQSSSAEFTFAACRLATTSEWIDKAKPDDLGEHLKRRLSRIAGRPEELSVLHLQSKRKAHAFHYALLVRPDVARIDSVNDNWTSLNRLALIPSEPLAVTTLLLRLGKAAEAEHELFAIWKTCMLSWKKIENDATGLQEPTYGILGTNWDFPGRTNPLSSDQRLREDWLKWFVGMQMLTSLRGIHSDVRPFPITNDMVYRFVELDENNDGYVAISDLDVKPASIDKNEDGQVDLLELVAYPVQELGGLQKLHSDPATPGPPADPTQDNSPAQSNPLAQENTDAFKMGPPVRVPLYENQTLEQWLDKLEIERSEEVQKQAVNAIVALADKNNRDTLVLRLTNLINERRKKEVVESNVFALKDGRQRGNYSSIDTSLINIICAHSSAQQLDSLLDEQLKSNDRERIDIWIHLFVAAEVIPKAMKAWTLSEIQSTEFSELSKESAATVIVAAYTICREDKEWRSDRSRLSRLFDAVSQHRDFGTRWVLESNPLTLSSNMEKDVIQEDQAIREEAAGVFALRVLHLSDNPDESTLAACRLATTTDWLEKSLQGDAMIKQQLTPRLHDLLKKITEQPDQLARFSPTNLTAVHQPNVIGVPLPPQPMVAPSYDGQTGVFQVLQAQARFIPCETLALHALIKRLKMQATFAEELQDIWQLCEPSWKKVEAKTGSRVRSDSYKTARQAKWDYRGISAAAKSPGDFRDSPEDWVKWYIGNDLLDGYVQTLGDSLRFKDPQIRYPAILKFLEADKDNDGLIPAAEVIEGQRAIDQDNDGQVSLKEFLTFDIRGLETIGDLFKK